MSNVKVNIENSGIEKKAILKHADVVLEIDKELKDEMTKENNMLGWIKHPQEYYDSEEYKKIKDTAKKIKKNSDVLVVIGIGGSYLGARAVIKALSNSFLEERDTKVIFVGNTLSPNVLKDTISYLEGKDFSINVISKSGTTLEPAISFRIFRELLENKYGLKEAKNRIFVTTDEEKGALRKLAKKEKYETFVIPNDIGGRFSVLTAVGLLPIAVAGINIDDILAGAITGEDKYSDASLKYNECYQYAVLRNMLYEDGKKVEILASYEPKMQYIEEWWKQLFAESEGKNKKGILPYSTIYTTDLHSLGQYVQDGERTLFETVLEIETQDKDIKINTDEDNLDGLNYLAGKKLSFVNEKAMEGTIKAHTEGGVPNIKISIKDLSPTSIGELIYFFEKACAMSAKLLEVNPFDQPGVEAYKKNMFKLLGKE